MHKICSASCSVTTTIKVWCSGALGCVYIIPRKEDISHDLREATAAVHQSVMGYKAISKDAYWVYWNSTIYNERIVNKLWEPSWQLAISHGDEGCPSQFNSRSDFARDKKKIWHTGHCKHSLFMTAQSAQNWMNMYDFQKRGAWKRLLLSKTRGVGLVGPAVTDTMMSYTLCKNILETNVRSKPHWKSVVRS